VSSDVQVAVIGAGPYGLSLASYLADAHVSHVVIGEPMATWRRHMPRGMFLKSEGFASSIASPGNRCSLASFCSVAGRDYADTGLPVSIETFIAYGAWFEEQAVREVMPRTVSRLARNGSGFSLTLDDGSTVYPRRTVVAAGMTHCAYLPPELAALPRSVCTHTFDHASFDGFAGKEVAVVGAGQSALESAALIRESGARPRVLVRGPLLVWNPLPRPERRPLRQRLREPVAGLGAGWKTWVYSNWPLALSAFPRETRIRLATTTFGPAGAWWLRPRFENRVEVELNSAIVRASTDAGRVALELRNTLNGDRSTRRLEVDHVLAATGYRGDLERLDFLDDDLARSIATVAGDPVLSRRFESSVPGLYFVGRAAANTFGPVMRFVFGSRFASETVSSAVRRGA
jgi:cation diffusion facilitator CzcD-associated flavoprotein CzcO